jgi:hypothetical protein
MYRVGIEPDPAQLLRQSRHVTRMRVADRDHGMTTVKVQIAVAVGVPEVAAPGAGRFDVIERVHVKQMRHKSSGGISAAVR